MKRWMVDPVTPDEKVLAEAAALVRQGGVVIFPTDTLYGLAADASNREAVGLVFRVKQRGGSEALPLIADSLEQVERSGARMTALGRRVAEAFWPGPLSVVVDAGSRMAPALCGAGGTVAVRVPAHAAARGLAKAVGMVVTATSANVSGSTPFALAEDALAGLGPGAEVAGVLDAGPTPGGPPSTIVDVRGPRPVLLRQGAIPFDLVIAAVES